MKGETRERQTEEEYGVQASSQHSLHPDLPGSVVAFRVYDRE